MLSDHSWIFPASITNGAVDESNPVWKVLTRDCKDLIKGLLTVQSPSPFSLSTLYVIYFSP